MLYSYEKLRVSLNLNKKAYRPSILAAHYPTLEGADSRDLEGGES